MSLAKFSELEIFSKLAMDNTHVHDDSSVIAVPELAKGYWREENGTFKEYMTRLEMVGDGSIVTTVSDLAKWDKNFYQNRLGLGGPNLIYRVLRRGRLENNRLFDYAFGLRSYQSRGQWVVEHGGSFAGYRSKLLRFPEVGMSVSLLCNLAQINSTATAWEVVGIALGTALEAPASVSSSKVSPDLLRRYVGVYRGGWFSGGNFLHVQLEKRTLSELRPMEGA